MSPDFLMAAQTRLMQQRADLLAQIDRQHAGAASRAEATAQARASLQDDERVAAVEMELTMALEDREVVELNDIDAALLRITQGRYGECVACGADIAVARLHAAPAAGRCIVCQSQLEQAHGKPHFASL